MHGKVIGFNLTDVATWPLLELNKILTPSVWTLHEPGGQLHVRRWVSRLDTLRRIPREVNSRSPPDARGLSEGLHDIDTRQYARGVTSDDAPGILLSDGQVQLRELVHLPRNWPLARLTIPLAGLSKQVDRLLEGYCFQILATNRDPDTHVWKVIQTATHLTLILAEYLADTIAWLMRSILDHESKILFDTDGY